MEGLKTIPGVGDYTAGAVASIAFNVQAPLVDGNVIRVISRLEAFPGDLLAPPSLQSAAKPCRFGMKLWEARHRAVAVPLVPAMLGHAFPLSAVPYLSDAPRR